MFQIEVLAIGRIKEKYLLAGIKEYLKRMSPYARIQITELPDFSLPPRLSPAEVAALLTKEADTVHRRLKNNTHVILLDVGGKEMSTEALAEYIRHLGLKGQSHLSFIIGGTLGVAPSLRSRADFCLSLSPMTFPHQLVRLLLVEQLYRCFKINSGEPYHY